MESVQKRIDAIEKQRKRGGPKQLLAELEQLRRDQARGEWRPTVSRFAKHGVGDAIIQVEDQIAKALMAARKKEVSYQEAIEKLTEERGRLEKQLATLD